MMMNLSPDLPSSKPPSNNSTFNQNSPSIPKKLFSQGNSKSFTVSIQDLHDPLTKRFKTTKSFVWDLRDHTKARLERLTGAQILQNQLSLLKLKLIINSIRPFETALVSSQIKYLPSLHTLELVFDTDFASILRSLKAIAIYLPSLKKLATLDLAFSCTEFPCPSKLHQLLRALKTLKKLTNCSLTFDNPENMTDSDLDLFRLHLCKLTQLRSFTLILENTEDLTNHSITNLALSLPKLSSLDKIHLELTGFSNPITSSTILQLFSSFRTLKNLTDITFELERSKIEFDTQTDPLSEGLLSLQPSQIQKLILYPYGDYDTSALVRLTHALSRFDSLHTLGISLCSSDQITVESINQSLFQLQNLHSLSSLSLSFGSLKIPSLLIANVAPVLQSLIALKSLKLDFLDLAKTQDEEIIMLSQTLACLTSLTSLSITFKKAGSLTDRSLESLALSFKELPLLNSLGLYVMNANWVTNDGVEGLTKGLKGLKNLETLALNFHDNQKIDKIGLERIATTLESLPRLFKFSLYLMKCKGLVTPCEMYQNLLRVIRDMRTLQEVTLVLPFNGRMRNLIRQIQKRKNTKITYWA